MRQNPELFPHALLYHPFRLSCCQGALWAIQDGNEVLIDLRSIVESVGINWRRLQSTLRIAPTGLKLAGAAARSYSKKHPWIAEACMDKTGRPTLLVSDRGFTLCLDFLLAHAWRFTTAAAENRLAQLRRVWRYEWRDVLETDLAGLDRARNAATQKGGTP